jgi:hypothetical protein
VYWNVTDKLTLMAGFTRGWEEALKDHNDVIDGIGMVKYAFTDRLTGFFNFVVGPEMVDTNDDNRVVLDGVLTYAVTDAFSVGANADWGYEEGDLADGDAAQWYGVALYAGYKINDPLTVNVRGEWFNDDDGARGLGTTVYEGTAGLTITPFPSTDIASNLKIRPEVRVDYGEDAIFDGENSQVTLAIDAIFSY